MPRVRPRISSIVLPPFDPLNTRAAELRAAGHHVISLGQAVPYFQPPPAAIDAIRRALDTDPDIHRYGSDPGELGLREALGARLGVKAGELVISAGGNHAFTLVMNTVVDAGDEVVLPAPYFTNHHGAIVAAGATPIEAPIADRETFQLRWRDLEPHLTAKTKAVVLCNPSNPTGAAIDAADGEEIVRELARRHILVVSDETYMHFVYDGAHWSARSAPKWRDNVIVIGTFSKSFAMMGWRVGFLLADAAVCAEAIKVQDAMIICAPVISQRGAEAAVRDAWEYPLSFREELRARRGILAEGLAAIRGVHWSPTRGGLFALARIDSCTDSMALSSALLEQAHVVTIPGAAFGRAGEGHLRISYGYASQPDLREALRRLSGFLSKSIP